MIFWASLFLPAFKLKERIATCTVGSTSLQSFRIQLIKFVLNDIYYFIKLLIM